jgi:hypothetical protein
MLLVASAVNTLNFVPAYKQIEAALYLCHLPEMHGI